MKMGEAAYQAEQAEGGAEDAGTNQAEDADVVDADFEEVDDEQDSKKA